MPSMRVKGNQDTVELAQTVGKIHNTYMTLAIIVMRLQGRTSKLCSQHRSLVGRHRSVPCTTNAFSLALIGTHPTKSGQLYIYKQQ